MPKGRVAPLEKTPSNTQLWSLTASNPNSNPNKNGAGPSTISTRPPSAVSTFGINPSISSNDHQHFITSPRSDDRTINTTNNTTDVNNTTGMSDSVEGKYTTTIPVPKVNRPPSSGQSMGSQDSLGLDLNVPPEEDDTPVFSVHKEPEGDETEPAVFDAAKGPGPGHPFLSDQDQPGDTREGLMEMTNMFTNPGGGDGDLPPISIGMPGKKDESSEALNLSLHQCSRDGDEYNMKILIRNLTGNVKKKINAYDEDDLTPLHYAARYNHLSVVKLLVEAGADTQMRGEDDVTPLHHAARYRREKTKKRETQADDEDDEVSLPPPDIQLTEEELANETEDGNLEQNEEFRNEHDRLGDAADGEDGENETITQLGANGLPTLIDQYDVDKEGSVITYLISHGANINCNDIYGQTPLHFAAMRGNEVAARDLLSFRDRIVIEAQDNQGITPLHMAAIHNHLEVASMLLQAGSNLMCRDKELSTPLHHAATEGNIDLVQMLFDAGARTKEAWVTLAEMVSATDIESSTCLHHAVDNGHFQVAQLLLEKRAEVNKPRKHFMYPIHLAAQSGNKEIVRLLIENQARIDAVNDDQATALHRAAALDHVEVAKFLVDRGARINRRDKDNFTPLLLAATYGNTATVELLLKKGADYTSVDKYDKTAIFLTCEENKVETLEKLLSYPQVKKLVNDSDVYDNDPLHIAAQEGFLNVVKVLLSNGASLDSKNEEEQTPLHMAAKYGRTNIVRELVKEDHSIVNDEDENSNTALHLAAQYGHNKVAKMLLDLGADVSARNYNQWTPLDLAASKGWTKTCNVLLEEDAPVDPTDKNKTTPLHLAASSGHANVVELLLEWEADVTLQDDEGRNCLDRAIEDNNPQVALVIINSSFWKDALRNATKDPLTHYVDTPMRKLIRKMPDIAERVFDRCLSYGAEKNPERLDYEITFDYEFLDDGYAKWIREGIQRLENPDNSEYGSSTGSSYGGDEEDNRLPPDAQQYTSDTNVLKKNHPMFIMVSSAREDLLAHPLVTSLLTHKWNTFGRFFYYLSFFIYCIFLVFLTGYMVVSEPPHNFSDADRQAIEDDTCSAALLENRSQDLFAKIGTYVIIALAAFNVLKELLQIYQAKLNYLGWTNLIEWIVYITALLLVISFNECQRETGYRYDWQWNLGAIAIFLAWIDLVLIIQKVPRFGIYVVMFTDILYTFSQFFVVFFLFIVAFALAFHVLLQNQVEFSSVGYALMKTSVMMIGEFEYTSIFHADYPAIVHYRPAAYVIWVIFLVIMSILLMNLLVGLAVDDIKAVQEQAILKRFAMQVELALNVERIIPDFIRRKQFSRRKTLRPNQVSRNPLVRFMHSSSAVSAEALQKALNPELDEIEKVQEAQEKIGGDVKSLKKAMKAMKEQNQKLESMLKAIVTAQNITWQEEDYQEDDEMEMNEQKDGGV